MQEGTAGADPRMVHVWAIKALSVPLLVWAVLIFPAAYLAAYNGTIDVDRRILVVALLLVSSLLLVFAYVWAELYHRAYRWRLGAGDVQIWSGILFRRRTTIPYIRIQNVNVVRGPLLILLGLSSVEIETAGQRGVYHGGVYRSEGFLPGLADGEETADLIISRVTEAKARGGL